MIRLLLMNAVLAFSLLNATTVLYQSYNDLVNKADGVVTGVVSKIDYRENGNGDIFTFVTLKDVAVHNALYQGNEFTFRVKGGIGTDDILEVVGAPKFDIDEEVVVFIKDNGKRIVPIVGWEQGVFKVKQNQNLEKYMTDANENIIFDIDSKGKISKENKHKSELHILHRENITMSGQAKALEKTQIIDDDDLVDRAPGNANGRTLPPLTKEAFLKKLQTHKKQTANAAMGNGLKAINSIKPGNAVANTQLESDSPSSEHAAVVNTKGIQPDALPKSTEEVKNENQY